AIESYGQSLETFRRLGNMRGSAISLYGIGISEAMVFRFDEAREHLLAAMAIFAELRDNEYLAESFLGLARIALDEDKVERAARLIGAAEGCRNAAGIKLTPIETAEHDLLVGRARHAIGDWALMRHIGLGRGKPVTENIRFTLSSDALQ